MQTLALVGFSAVAVLYLRPIWAVFSTHIAPDPYDPVFNLYLLKWVGHEVRRGLSGFWDAPFFFPTRGAITYSDHLFGPGLAATALTGLLPSWVAAYNGLLLASFALTGWTMSFVLRRGGRSWTAALLGGAMYTFSPFRWDQLPHLPMLLMAAIPPTLWTFDRLLAAPSWKRAAAFLPCYLIHLSGGCYLAYMIHVPLLVLALHRAPELWRREPAERRREARVLLAVAAAAALALAAVFGKYWQVARRDQLVWTPKLARQWGASLLSYLQPDPLNTYAGIWPEALRRPGNFLFPGWMAAALAAAGAVALWRARRRGPEGPEAETEARRPPRWLLAPLGLAALGWLTGELHTWSKVHPFEFLERWVVGHGYNAALAMVLAGTIGWAVGYRRWAGRWWTPAWLGGAAGDRWQAGLLLAGCTTAALASPLFFLPTARLLPGLGAMRVLTRFHAFTMVAIVWLAAATVDQILARVRRRHGTAARRAAGATRTRCATWLSLGMAACLLLELAPRRIPWIALPAEDDFPQVYQWVADRPEIAALLELPINRADMPIPEVTSIGYMYYGTLHWRPLVNGYGAHLAHSFDSLRARCCRPVPDAATLDLLRSWGVTHLLVHRSLLPPPERRLLAQWDATGSAELVYAGGGDRVYLITGRGRP